MLRRFLARQDLIELLRTGVGAAAEALRSDAEALGDVLESPQYVLAALLVVVSSSDDDLSARIHHAEAVRKLDELQEGLGFVFGELLGELLEIRIALGQTGNRTDRLLSLVKEADASVVQSFIALGVDEGIARVLAADPRTGTDAHVGVGDTVVFAGVSGKWKESHGYQNPSG